MVRVVSPVSFASTIEQAPSHVPLREPRSRKRRPSGRASSDRCRREMPLSTNTRSTSADLPTTSLGVVMRIRWPRLSPERTKTSAPLSRMIDVPSTLVLVHSVSSTWTIKLLTRMKPRALRQFSG